jgi:hypothetical protein
MAGKRKQHTAAFKAQVALAAHKGCSDKAPMLHTGPIRGPPPTNPQEIHEEIHATIYYALGLPESTEMHDTIGRSLSLCHWGIRVERPGCHSGRQHHAAASAVAG